MQSAGLKSRVVGGSIPPLPTTGRWCNENMAVSETAAGGLIPPRPTKRCHGAARSARLLVTEKVAGSNPAGTAKSLETGHKGPEEKGHINDRFTVDSTL